jgi:hypothetical protein
MTRQSRSDNRDGNVFTELAGLLARGVMRHLQQRRIGDEQNQNSLASGLEVSPATVLSVTNPVNGPESPQQGARV